MSLVVRSQAALTGGMMLATKGNLQAASQRCRKAISFYDQLDQSDTPAPKTVMMEFQLWETNPELQKIVKVAKLTLQDIEQTINRYHQTKVPGGFSPLNNTLGLNIPSTPNSTLDMNQLKSSLFISKDINAGKSLIYLTVLPGHRPPLDLDLDDVYRRALIIKGSTCDNCSGTNTNTTEISYLDELNWMPDV
ncbi:hypothetical protein HDU76_012658, partial [Blyttiomyces sp. JEL0837]